MADFLGYSGRGLFTLGAVGRTQALRRGGLVGHFSAAAKERQEEMSKRREMYEEDRYDLRNRAWLISAIGSFLSVAAPECRVPRSAAK